MARSLYFTNRKEYYRRKRISEGLRLFYQTGKTKAQRKETATVKSETKEFLKEFVDKKRIKKRERRQLCYNSDYSMSLRAIVINGKQTEEDLDKAIGEFFRSNAQLMNDTSWSMDVKGMETKLISVDEDKGLTEGVIYIELNIRGSVDLIEWQ